MSRLTTSAVAAAILILVTATRAAHADNPFADGVLVSPGIKVGYTFGDDGGFSYGAEVTMLLEPGVDLPGLVMHGPALNVGWSHRGTFHLRAGWQLVSWLIGIEAGPALVWRDGQAHLGLGVTPWVGGIIIPYYTYTFIPGAANHRDVGSYLKLPLCLGCESLDGDGDGDDDDDFDFDFD